MHTRSKFQKFRQHWAATHRQPSLRQPMEALVALFAITVIGTLGYHVLEHVDLFEAFYFTVITLATIGYGELPNFSPVGKAFTIFLVLTNIVIFSYAVGTLTQFLIGGTIQNMLGARKMTKEIAKLEKHFIVCGYGRLGETIVEQLQAYGKDFVVIDGSSEICRTLADRNILAIWGDASEDEILREAGVERATTLIVATPQDAISVYITLTARTLNPAMRIIARAVSENAERKLMRAGADRVVLPTDRGGVYMAQAALRPSVVDFLDVTSSPGGEKIQLEELVVPPNSFADSKTLGQLNIGNTYSLMVVAIRHAEGATTVEFNPRAGSKVHAGDTLVILGEYKNLMAFEHKLHGH